MKPNSSALVLALSLGAMVPGTVTARAADAPPPPRPPGHPPPAELAATKQAEARRHLEALEESMDRLAGLLEGSEPENSRKLREALRSSRERLLRETMNRAEGLLREGSIDRAIEEQSAAAKGLGSLLDVLTDRPPDPAELAKAIGDLRGIVGGLDRALGRQKDLRARTGGRTESSDAEKAAASLAGLDGLIDRQREIEAGLRAGPGAGDLGKIAERQRKALEEARALQNAAKEPSPEMDRALSAMDAAAGAAAGAAGDPGKGSAAAARAAEAVAALEEARRALERKLSPKGDGGDAASLAARQDAIGEETDEVLRRMERKLPLRPSVPEGVPGREEVAKGRDSMARSSRGLAAGDAAGAGQAQEEAIARLEEGKKKAGVALERLRQGLRERLLSYLRERYGTLLASQKEISGATARLAPGRSDRPDGDRRGDLQETETLSRREGDLATAAGDLRGLLEEDATTVVFPRLAAQVEEDLRDLEGRLGKADAGEETRRVQAAVEEALGAILAILDEAARAGRGGSGSGEAGEDGPEGKEALVGGSAELRMVRSLQERVNRLTDSLHRELEAAEPPDGEERARKVARLQREVGELLRKVKEEAGEE